MSENKEVSVVQETIKAHSIVGVVGDVRREMSGHHYAEVIKVWKAKVLKMLELMKNGHLISTLNKGVHEIWKKTFRFDFDCLSFGALCTNLTFLNEGSNEQCVVS